MTPSGDTVNWDVKEVFLPMTGLEFFSTRNGCNTAGRASARWTQHFCHGLTWDPWDNGNVRRVSQAFTGFCRNLGVARIFLKGNQAEEDRVRSWFKLPNSTFDIPRYASADWRYIALEQSSLQPFVMEVRENFRHHWHMLRDPTAKRKVFQN